jgi:hypothetical protein
VVMGQVFLSSSVSSGSFTPPTSHDRILFIQYVIFKIYRLFNNIFKQNQPSSLYLG